MTYASPEKLLRPGDPQRGRPPAHSPHALLMPPPRQAFECRQTFRGLLQRAARQPPGILVQPVRQESWNRCDRLVLRERPRHLHEKRELALGERESNMVLHFNPNTGAPMTVACLWSHWTHETEPDLAFLRRNHRRATSGSSRHRPYTLRHLAQGRECGRVAVSYTGFPGPPSRDIVGPRYTLLRAPNSRVDRGQMEFRLREATRSGPRCSVNCRVTGTMPNVGIAI